MATKIQEVERDGHRIAIYESGAEYDLDAKRLVKAPPRAAITKENSNEYRRKRQEKTARLLRERIVQAHNRADMDLVGSSAEAIAESGALLYEEIVLNRTAYPRDRVETWEKLGKYAGSLPSDLKRTDDNASVAQAAAIGAAAGAAAAFKAVLDDVLNAGDNSNYRKHEVIDAQTSDTDSDTETETE